MATVIDAAGNLVFTLILNSIRELYLGHLERFRPIVTGREELAPLYRRAARAIVAGEGGRAAAADRAAGRRPRSSACWMPTAEPPT